MIIFLLFICYIYYPYYSIVVYINTKLSTIIIIILNPERRKIISEMQQQI